MSTIFLGADHGGFALKAELRQWLEAEGYPVVDVGALTLDPADDYPDFAFQVAEQVAANAHSQAKGIILCRTSAGVVICANKVPGIMAVSVNSPELAKAARDHNDANVIGLGADSLHFDQAKAIVTAFLETDFSQDERHVRRLTKIKNYEKK